MLHLVLPVVIWTCVVIFILTGVITILSLLGFITLGGSNGSYHHYYLKNLFKFLIIEVVVVGIGTFGAHLSNASELEEAVQGLQKVSDKPTVTPVDSLSQVSMIVHKFSTTKRDTIVLSKLNDSSQVARVKEIIAKYGQEISRISKLDTIRLKNSYETLNERLQYLYLDTLRTSVFAISEYDQVVSSVVKIPPEYQYVNHRSFETAKSGDAMYKVEKIKEGDEVSALRIIAKADDRGLFGLSNWIGAKLQVVVKKESPVVAPNNSSTIFDSEEDYNIRIHPK